MPLSWDEAKDALYATIRQWAPDFEPVETGLTLKRDEATIYVEPTRFAVGSLPTCFDLYAEPSFRRVRLFGPIGGKWDAQTAEGVTLGYGWNPLDFARLLDEIVKH